MNKFVSFAVVLLALGGCATYPNGPSLMALPGAGAGFEQFQADDNSCQAYARQSTGFANPQQPASSSGVDSAVVGTAVGAAAGALIGAASGNAAAGAAIGGGSGLLVGATSGSGAYAATGSLAQERYDNAYVQCMYARGHQVPVPAAMAAQLNSMQPQPPAAAYPNSPAHPPTGGLAGPPPPGTYPPPGTPPPPGY